MIKKIRMIKIDLDYVITALILTSYILFYFSILDIYAIFGIILFNLGVGLLIAKKILTIIIKMKIIKGENDGNQNS